MTVDHDRLAALLPAYEIGDELGRGGWGVVIGARHRQLERPVAIKQLPPALSVDPTVRERFLAEARVLAKLDHPHIVPVYDFVEGDGLCLLVMEELSGGTLWHRFDQIGLSMEASCAAVLAACSGLHLAHQRGVLHRDVKPENLLFSSAGVLKITDFGIAKVVGGEETMATRAGHVLGTPAYMSPEQAVGSELGPPTDVYATGTMLYELLSGRLPFSAEGTMMSVLYRHMFESPPPLLEVAPAVPEAIATVVMRAVAQRAGDRYATAEEFGVALAEATTAVWGPGWLSERSDIAVTGSTPIQTATERAAALAPGDRPTRLTARPGTEAIPVVVHPAEPAQAPSPPRLSELSAADLVPVRRIVAGRSRAVPLLVAALALLAITVGAALLTRGTPGSGGSIPRGSLTVAGAQPVPGRSLALDTASPVTVSAVVPPAAAGADTARLSFSVAGVPLGTVTAPLESGDGGRAQAALDLGERRYLVASGSTATLSLLRGGAGVADASFMVSTGQSSWLTAPGIGAVLLLLFSLAYLESLLRTLRAGRGHVSRMAGLMVIGPLLGVSVALLAWIATGRPPSTAGLVLCGLLGGAAAVTAGAGAMQQARRRRFISRP